MRSAIENEQTEIQRQGWKAGNWHFENGLKKRGKWRRLRRAEGPGECHDDVLTHNSEEEFHVGGNFQQCGQLLHFCNARIEKCPMNLADSPFLSTERPFQGFTLAVGEGHIPVVEGMNGREGRIRGESKSWQVHVS